MIHLNIEDLYDKRVQSLANQVAGATHERSAAIHTIGAAYACVAEMIPKCLVKLIDRYLGNEGIDVEGLAPVWAKFVIGSRRELLLVLDWTEFEDHGHTTLCAYLATSRGRTIPLAWKTYKKSKLTDGARTNAGHAMVELLSRAIPPDIEVTLLADRGFPLEDFYQTLSTLGWDYVIRLRGSIMVQAGDESKTAKQWLLPSGRATKLVNAKATRHGYEVGAVVVIKRKGMKDAWYLATSLASASASAIVNLYSRRFTIEETVRDEQDIRFGMGLSAYIREEDRRDRLLMLLAMAQALFTLLGAASERSDLDVYLKANTVKRRTHSLHRQGEIWYDDIPTMRDEWFERLMTAFDEILEEQADMRWILGHLWRDGSSPAPEAQHGPQQ
jgi:hypothetical protein